MTLLIKEWSRGAPRTEKKLWEEADPVLPLGVLDPSPLLGQPSQQEGSSPFHRSSMDISAMTFIIHLCRVYELLHNT